MTNIQLDTALALLREGLAIIPTAGQGEKRPFGKWKEFQSRLPAEDEVRGWFAVPRPGGIVCGAVSGNLEVIDLDTPEAYAAFAARFGGDAPCEASPHGGHAWYRCDEIGRNGKPAEKVDTRAEGGFCVCYEPQALLARGVPRVTPEKRAEMFAFVAGGGCNAAGGGQPPGSVWSILASNGWKAGAERNGWIAITNGTKTGAISANGETVKMFSTSIWAAPEKAETPAPQVVSAAELARENPQLAEPVVSFCRRGSFALVAGDPKAGKTTFSLKLCAKKASEGLTCLYADFENGPALFWHRLNGIGGIRNPERLHYLDCRYVASIDYVAAAARALGKVDVLVIDCWGLLIAGDGVEDESSNALVSAYFQRVRRTLAEAAPDAATLILHHTPKSGANEKLCFAGAGASSLQRYVQTIARISQDNKGAYWFAALAREFDVPFKPVLLRTAKTTTIP